MTRRAGILLGVALAAGCAAPAPQRLEAVEVRELVHARLGAPLDEVARDLRKLGFRCEHSKADYWRFESQTCSRDKVVIAFAPRVTRNQVEVDLLAAEGQSVLSNYRVGERRQ
jgi:hypothetical protein